MLWNLCKPMSIAYLVENKTIAYSLLDIVTNKNNSKEYIDAYIVMNSLTVINPG